MKKIKNIFLLATSLFMMSSCDKFLDVNTDPNNPSKPVLELLLPATQVSLGVNIAGSALNRAASVAMQHAYILGLGRYDYTGATFQTAWNNLYSQALNDLEIIIKNGTEAKSFGYVGMAKIEKAYIYSIMVDLWGDVPYTEASQGETNLTPKFDKGADIYKDLFRLIDEGIADLNRTPYISPGTVDLFYRGDRALWIRAANTLKLKMLNQIRLVPSERDRVIKDINALIAGNQLITTGTQDWVFRFGTTETPQNRHPTHISEYRATKDFYMDQGFMERLYSLDDLRLRYYIYRQNPNAGVNFTSTGNGYGGRFAGDPTGQPADQANRATFGIYPYGGIYDNNTIRNLPTTLQFLTNTGATTPGVHKVVTTSDGTGAGIFPMVTSYMTNFILAESALTLGTTGTVRTYLRDGVVQHLQAVSSFAAGNSGPAIPQATIDAFVTRVLTQYDALTTPAARLNFIMTQKYIATVGNGIEAYNDYRRTGSPTLSIPLSPVNPFPLRFLYSTRELTANPNAPAQNNFVTPVFWDL
jgi:Starch-binding associating with outer membrane